MKRQQSPQATDEVPAAKRRRLDPSLKEPTTKDEKKEKGSSSLGGFAINDTVPADDVKFSLTEDKDTNGKAELGGGFEGFSGLGFSASFSNDKDDDGKEQDNKGTKDNAKDSKKDDANGGESFLSAWESYGSSDKPLDDKPNESGDNKDNEFGIADFNWESVDWNRFEDDGNDSNNNNNNDDNNNKDKEEAEKKGKKDDKLKDRRKSHGISDNGIDDGSLEAVGALSGEQLDSGDSDDKCQFETLVKVFIFNKTERQYKEKGCGLMQVNTVTDGSNTYGRLLCRREKVHNIILNAPIYKDDTYTAVDGFVRFYVFEKAEVAEKQKSLLDDDDDNEEEKKDNGEKGEKEEKEEKEEGKTEDKEEIQCKTYLIKPVNSHQFKPLLQALHDVQAIVTKTKTTK